MSNTTALAELQNLLQTRVMGRPTRWLESSRSTNKDVEAEGRGGRGEGLVVVADHQDGGRGRLGRVWFSPPGVNLYLSLLLRPRVDPAWLSRITTLVALAGADTLEELGLPASIKWPNDLMVSGRKIGGILCEAHFEGGRVGFVVAGLGINLNVRSFPPELEGLATSFVLETGREVHLPTFVALLLARIESLYLSGMSPNFQPSFDRWRKVCSTVGHRVCYEQEGRQVGGTAVGIGEDGSLIVMDNDGREYHITAGDVRLETQHVAGD